MITGGEDGRILEWVPSAEDGPRFLDSGSEFVGPPAAGGATSHQRELSFKFLCKLSILASIQPRTNPSRLDS